ncbi:cold shock domain-containing protein [Vibrio breoganii]|uniref:cold shock domain-containing protein n=1 Tax=Vibrio breoganii TaxID=553239 RepID=UPI000C856193|nr:cold shock domain-containing protein [Vibrio breoganii]PML53113.1 cold-shock protein [Vibrio breoganii]PMO83417.1 cold-shock protein [Vibrio breoganii]
MKGKIVRWVDKKGFGFIQSSDTNGDVFAHISQFQSGYRRPQLGDDVEFEIGTSKDKVAARNVTLIGVKPLKSDVSPLSVVFLGLLIAFSGYALWAFVVEPRLNPPYENMGFSCQGKTHCSQMTSCNEAMFYLDNCPNVKIDGDNDSIPCESQLCG